MESRQPHPQQAFSEVPILASGLPIIPTGHRTTGIVSWEEILTSMARGHVALISSAREGCYGQFLGVHLSCRLDPGTIHQRDTGVGS
jgi:hypothetical protein